MRVWVLTVGEPLPTETGTQRPHRSGMLCRALVERGHQVTWWTSGFDHFTKRQVHLTTTRQSAGPDLELVRLATSSYPHNISIRRIRSNRRTAREFERLAPDEPRPDVILASYPLVELVDAAARYGKARGVPVVADIRDLWPDIWLEAAPAKLRPLARIAARPFFTESACALTNVDAICAITESCVTWGLERAGRGRRAMDRAIPLGFPAVAVPEVELAAADTAWGRRLALDAAVPPLICCYFGQLTERTRVDVPIRAAALVPENLRSRIRIVICGRGDHDGALRRLGEGLPHLCLPGFVGPADMAALARRARVGLLPYPDTPDFVRSLPNKFFEYLAHGLAVVTSLSGDTAAAIERFGCGIRYATTDPVDLARLLTRLIDEPGPLAELGARARATFEAQFREDLVYGAFAAHLENLAALPAVQMSASGVEDSR